MLKKLNNSYYRSIGIIITIFLFGSFISLQRGSNLSDGDSYSLLLSFLNFLDLGTYSPSRGAYGHLIPEMALGSAAYLFGVPVSNLICFIFFFSAIFIFFITFINQNIERCALFFLLIASNFYLFFENTNTIDYPLGLFFFSVGLYFLKKEKFFLSSIFFAITICSRANFCIFVYPVILIYFLHNKILLKKFRSFLLISSLTTIIGLIFFIPVFYVNSFSLDFLNIPFITNTNTPGWYGGPAISFTSLFPRFIFKIYNFIGPFSSFFLIILFFVNLKILTSLKNINQKIIWCIIVINLLMYFFAPTKILLLNPFLIFLYILFFTHLKKKIICGIIIFNFIPWFIGFDLLDIKYKSNNICEARVALSANFNFSFKQGEFINYINHPSYSGCYSIYMREYSDNFLKNKPLSSSK